MAKIDKIIVNALEVKQPGVIVYVFQISGKKLSEISCVSRRSDEPKKGIQRVLKKSRIRSIGEFIDSKNAMLANNIVVSIEDDEAKFIPDSKDSSTGILEFSIKPGTIWIADGQHRTFGFNQSEKDFNIIVSATLNVDREISAMLFYKINKEAKRVDPNLAYDLLDLIGKEENPLDYQLHKIVKRLDTDKDSPFKDMVRMTDGRDEDKILTQAAIITKLKWFLKTERGEILKESEDNVNEEALLDVIKAYFGTIKELQSEAWNNDGYILTKGVGFGAFMKLLPQVISTALHRERRVTLKVLKEILEPLEDVNFSSEDSEFKGMQGEQGMKEIADILKSQLNLIKSSEVYNF